MLYYLLTLSVFACAVSVYTCAFAVLCCAVGKRALQDHFDGGIGLESMTHTV